MIARHSGLAGDTVFSLPVLRHLKTEKLYITPHASQWERGLGLEYARQVVELLSQQQYLEVELWTGQEYDMNLDSFRPFALQQRRRHLLRCHALAAGLAEETPLDLSPWLTVEPLQVAPVVVHRTNRYPGDLAFDWRLLDGLDAVQVGLPGELTLKLPYHPTKTLLELAQVIAGAKVLVCNQSVGLTVAEAIGLPYFVQVNPDHSCAMPLTSKGQITLTHESLHEIIDS